jgi:hypothetical protein
VPPGTRTQTRKGLAIVYHTANAGQTVLSTWIFYKKSVWIIHRNLNGSAERLRCFGHLLLSLWRTWDLDFLVIEPFMGVTPSVHLKAMSVKRSLWRAQQPLLGPPDVSELAMAVCQRGEPFALQ